MFKHWVDPILESNTVFLFQGCSGNGFSGFGMYEAGLRSRPRSWAWHGRQTNSFVFVVLAAIQGPWDSYGQLLPFGKPIQMGSTWFYSFFSGASCFFQTGAPMIRIPVASPFTKMMIVNKQTLSVGPRRHLLGVSMTLFMVHG